MMRKPEPCWWVYIEGYLTWPDPCALIEAESEEAALAKARRLYREPAPERVRVEKDTPTRQRRKKRGRKKEGGGDG